MIHGKKSPHKAPLGIDVDFWKKAKMSMLEWALKMPRNLVKGIIDTTKEKKWKPQNKKSQIDKKTKIYPFITKIIRYNYIYCYWHAICSAKKNHINFRKFRQFLKQLFLRFKCKNRSLLDKLCGHLIWNIIHYHF